MSYISTTSSTPTKIAQTTTETLTRTTTVRSPRKVTTRTITTSSTRTITTPTPTSTPSRQEQSRSPDPSEEFDELDDPNEDASITFASAMSSPPTPPPSPSQHTLPRSNRLSPSTVRTELPSSGARAAAASHSASAGRDNNNNISEFYERRYPGRVPHPEAIIPVVPSPPCYYSVTAGLQVGVFGDWNLASSLVTGVSGARFKGHRRFHQAWLAYYQEYMRKEIKILDEYQNTAPLRTQLVDLGLDHLFHDLSL
ncbi:hypothetical protein PQX77_009483 [Marasmius sp. AFHP31]|nr:hypothetical protein PQX77_009483 [Marasmius sp. AFHP31]